MAKMNIYDIYGTAGTSTCNLKSK